MHSCRQALLEFGVQANVVHKMSKIYFTRFNLVYDAECFKHSLMCLVRFCITQGVYNKHLDALQFFKFRRLYVAHICYICELAKTVCRYRHHTVEYAYGCYIYTAYFEWV